MRILHVDDEPSILRLSPRILSPAGHDVTVAPSGSQAIGVVKSASEKFDALLTDQNMPEMTGLELLAELQKLGLLPAIVIFVTSDDISEGASAILGDNYMVLAKPITNKGLLEIVAKAAAKGSTEETP